MASSPKAPSPAANPAAKRAAPAGLATRKAAVDLVHAVLVERRPLDEALAYQTAQGSLSHLEARDRAHARLIVATTLRRLGQIDAALARFLAKGLPAERGRLREILRTAAAQLLFLDAAPHAVVSLAVSLAQRDPIARRYEKLANAVLRRLSEQRADILAGQDAARLGTPDWLWQSWERAYGDETARAIATSHLCEAALDISVREDAAGWAQRLDGVLLPTGSIRRTLEGRVEDLPGYAEGRWWVQDAAAALPVRLLQAALGDVRGRRILDLCAAPGGKTAQLAAAGADVTALDQSPTRMERLAQNLKRLGLSARCVVADAATYGEPGPFDAVILDAPCTATGTIRRHPDIPHLKSAGDVARLVPLQTTLLRHAATLVRPGGSLVYCTCSLQPEEGVDRVTELLAADATVRLAPIVPGDVGGIARWITPDGCLRTLPSHSAVAEDAPVDALLRGVDGFFAARLLRVS